MKEDREIVGYFAKVVKNEYIKLSKRHCRIINNEVPLMEDLIQSSSSFEEMIEMDLTLKKALESLTPLQKNIVEKVILLETKEEAVAKELGITRQGVNRTKQRALNKLRNYLEKMELDKG